MVPCLDTHGASVSVVIVPNEVHMLWQVPQICLISLAEVLISVTGLEFSYSQAPLFMKSVLQVRRVLRHSSEVSPVEPVRTAL